METDASAGRRDGGGGLLSRVNRRLGTFEMALACVAMVLLLAANGYAIAAR